MKKTLLILLLLFMQMGVVAQEIPEKEIIPTTDDPEARKILTDHYKKLRFFRVQNIDLIDSLEQVSFIEADLNFFSIISEDGKTILLNEELKKYPNLMYMTILRRFGVLYEIEEGKWYGHDIMGDHWELNPAHEGDAYTLRTRSSAWIMRYYKAIQKKHELKKRL